MKIALSKLRSIIRETINEAPLADEDPIVIPTREQLPSSAVTSRKRTKDGSSREEMSSSQRKKLERFYSTPKYAKDARRYFSNVDVNVHILTRPGSDRSAFTPSGGLGSIRYETFEPQRAGAVLKRIGYSDIDLIDRMVGYLKKGDCVLVPMAAGIPADFWPTPWMTVHAAVDNDRGVLSSISLEISRGDYKINYFVEDDGIDQQVIEALTMKSAREDKILVPEDFFAEVITQEILTKGGFKFNPSGDEEVDEALEELKEKVSGARQAWENEIRGRLVIIDVVPDDLNFNDEID